MRLDSAAALVSKRVGDCLGDAASVVVVVIAAAVAVVVAAVVVSKTPRAQQAPRTSKPCCPEGSEGVGGVAAFGVPLGLVAVKASLAVVANDSVEGTAASEQLHP